MRSRIRIASSSRCGRREHRRHRLALVGVARLVHRDEARPVVAGRHVADPDAAERHVGGEDAVTGVDMHDVVVARDRPIGLDRRVGAVMHRLFLAQPLEPRPQRIVLEQSRRAGMELRQRRRIGLFAGEPLQLRLSVRIAVWMFIVDRIPNRCCRNGNSTRDPHRQGLVALDEARIHPLRLADHLNIVEPLQDFLPDDLQLQFGQPDPDAAVDAEAEGQVLARPGAVDDEIVRVLDRPPRRGCPKRTTSRPCHPS